MATLTQAEAHRLFEYRDGVLHWKIRPANCIRAGDVAGYKNPDGYWRVLHHKKMYLTHRIIYLMHHGELPEFVDHINGRRDDNRIENLRVATKAQNAQNARLQRNNTSGVKGVRQDHGRKWYCHLKVNKTSKCVYGFETKELAQEFIELWRELAHGQFANHGQHQGASA